MHTFQSLALVGFLASLSTSQIISDPGVYGPPLEIVHLYNDEWPTGASIAFRLINCKLSKQLKANSSNKALLSTHRQAASSRTIHPVLIRTTRTMVRMANIRSLNSSATILKCRIRALRSTIRLVDRSTTLHLRRVRLPRSILLSIWIAPSCTHSPNPRTERRLMIYSWRKLPQQPHRRPIRSPRSSQPPLDP